MSDRPAAIVLSAPWYFAPRAAAENRLHAFRHDAPVMSVSAPAANGTIMVMRRDG